MKNIDKRLAIIIALIILVTIGIVYVATKRPTIKKLDSDKYKISYDSTWKLKKNKDEIIFKHGSGSTVSIKTIDLDEENKYLSIDELIDEIIYSLKEQNPDYNYISEEKDLLTKYEFEGYKLLFEDKENQALANIYRKGNKIVIIIFEASNDYFDILLDSVNNIVYNLEVKEEKYDLSSSIDLELSDIKFGSNKELDKKIDKTKDEWIASSNYKITYSLPDFFEQNSIDSTSVLYNYMVDGVTKIRITTSVNAINIYEYLPNVLEKPEYYKKNDKYTDVSAKLNKIKGSYGGYIHYFTAKSKEKELLSGDEKQTTYETVTIMYPINNNHTFEVQIESTNYPITEKLINSISVKQAQNYASYIENTVENGIINSVLKRYKYDKGEKVVEQIKLKIPDKYTEIDTQQNIYTAKRYVLGYDKKLQEYEYQVDYSLNNFDFSESRIDSYNSTYFNSTYGESKNLTYQKDIIQNDKTFKLYEGYYTARSGVIFTSNNRYLYKVNVSALIYELPSGGYLSIIIRGNDKTISEEILNNVTNFSVE